MRAVRIHAFGEAPRVDEIDEPVAGEGQQLASVRYAAVNPIDIWVTKGTVAGGKQRLPLTLGAEGVVEIDGRPGTPASCTTPVAEGMAVHTQTERLKRLRANVSFDDSE